MSIVIIVVDIDIIIIINVNHVLYVRVFKIVKERNLDNIEIKCTSYKPIKKNLKIKEVIGFDTETRKGKCFLIGQYNNENDKLIKYIFSFHDIINFFFYRNFMKSINFFYNIKYDFNAIMKWLPIENLRELSKYDKTQFNKYTIYNIPNKSFSITYNKHTVRFYDLAQFYDFKKLKTVGIKFLNLKKENLEETGIDIKNLSPERYLNDIDYQNNLKKYLYMDVEITKKLGLKIYEMFKDYLIPSKFYSQASFSQQYYLENLENKQILPKKKILQYALNAYQGGRFEVFKRGYFQKAYIQDIKSAYPYHNVQVPNVSKGKWIENKKYEKKALVSIYCINTNIPDLKISPMRYQLKNNKMIYPIGEFKSTYINKKELELLQDLNIKYEIISAVHYFDNNPEYPYKFLEKFYYEKERFKKEGNKLLSWIPKIIINGFYGKLIQMNPKLYFTKDIKNNIELIDVIEKDGELINVYKTWETGKLFNPIVANEITANTRVQLYRACMNKMDKIIGFQTDSIISEEKLDLDFSDKLGSWDMENEGELIILGSGVYQLLAKEPKIKLRGFSKSLDLHSMLKENNLSVKVTRNINLKKAFKIKNYEGEIIDDEKRYELFNLIKDEIKVIDLNFDTKRVWDRNFKDCNDVLTNKIDSKCIIN